VASNRAAKLALLIAAEALAQASAAEQKEGSPGKNGADASPEQIDAAVRAVFAERAEELRGNLIVSILLGGGVTVRTAPNTTVDVMAVGI